MKKTSRVLSVVLSLVILLSTICSTNIVSAAQYNINTVEGWEYDNNLRIGVNTEIADQLYTGEPITPEVAVNDDGGEPLVLDKDYTLTYTNNTDVGIASVTVTGLRSDYDNYEGFVKTINYNIVPTVNGKNISELQDVNLNTISNRTFQLNVSSSVKATYESSDVNVVTVSEDGLLTAVNKGIATVTINACDGTNLPSDKGTKTIQVTVTDYQLDKTDLSLYIGDNDKLNIIPTTEEITSINWTSSDNSIVKVDNNGSIKALKEGKATVTAKIDDTYELTCSVNVKYPITRKNINLKAGQKVNIGKQNGVTGTLKFKSNNPKIATVNINGTVQGIKKGNTKVVVTRNGVNILVNISVKTNAEIKSNSKTNKIIILNKKQLSISGKVGKQSYSSSNKKVATVNGKGNITAKKIGKATIKVKTNGITLTYKVQVIRPIIRNLDKKRIISMYVNNGKTLKISGRSKGKKNRPYYLFTNNKIAKYSKGKIVGKKAGRTKLKIKVNGVWQKITVRVLNPTISVSKKNMKVCDTYVITTKGAKGTYSSNNSRVVAVNKKNGKLVAKKAGKAVITVNLKCIKRKCTVTVREGAYPYGYKIAVNKVPKKVNLYKGENKNISNIVNLYSNIQNIYKKKNCSKSMYNKLKNLKTQFTYKSSDNKIAYVNQYGTIVPKAKGKATVIVTCKKTKKNYTLNTNITIKKKPTWGYVNYLGDRYKMKYVYSDKELVDAFVDAYMNYNLKGYEYPYIGIHCEYNTNVKNENAFYNKIIKLVSARNATLLDSAMNDHTFERDCLFDLDNGNHDVQNFALNTFTTKVGQNLYSASMDILNKANLSQYTNVDDKYYAIFDWVATNIKYDDEHAYSYKYSILNKKGVCADYAAAYQYLCLLAGLENILVDSDVGNHRWNVIKTSSGKWFNSDATNSKIMFGIKDIPLDYYKDYEYVNKFNNYAVANYNTDFYGYDECGERYYKIDKNNKFYKYR